LTTPISIFVAKVAENILFLQGTLNYVIPTIRLSNLWLDLRKPA